MQSWNELIAQAVDGMLVPGANGEWAVHPPGVENLEEALLSLRDDPSLIEAILFLTGVAHRLGTEHGSPEAAVAIMSTIGKVRPELVVFDRVETLLDSLGVEDQRRAEAFGVAQASAHTAPKEGEPPPTNSVKVATLNPQPPRYR